VSLRTSYPGRVPPTIKGNEHHTQMHTHHPSSTTGACPRQRNAKPTAAFSGNRASPYNQKANAALAGSARTAEDESFPRLATLANRCKETQEVHDLSGNPPFPGGPCKTPPPDITPPTADPSPKRGTPRQPVTNREGPHPPNDPTSSGQKKEMHGTPHLPPSRSHHCNLHQIREAPPSLHLPQFSHTT
jgi:hypothetical protein